jgi:CRISPR-associated protein Cas5 subtype I-A
LKLLSVIVSLHWGFSIKYPEVSKSQPTLPLPQPQTLVGALSRHIQDGLEHSYTVQGKKANLVSAASLVTFVENAAAGLTPNMAHGGAIWTDINRYLILHFQKPVRRELREYWFGVVPAGKVYAPAAMMMLAYAIDEQKALATLGDNWSARLIAAAWSITRLGFKEAIVCAEKVALNDAKPVPGPVETMLYFPNDAGRVEEGNSFTVDFWFDGFGAQRGKKRRYVVPGTISPLEGQRVKVQLTRSGKAYTDGENTLVW